MSKNRHQKLLFTPSVGQRTLCGLFFKLARTHPCFSNASRLWDWLSTTYPSLSKYIQTYIHTDVHLSTSAGKMFCWCGALCHLLFLCGSADRPIFAVSSSKNFQLWVVLFVLSSHQWICGTAIMQMFPCWLFMKRASPAFALQMQLRTFPVRAASGRVSLNAVRWSKWWA